MGDVLVWGKGTGNTPIKKVPQRKKWERDVKFGNRTNFVLLPKPYIL